MVFKCSAHCKKTCCHFCVTLFHCLYSGSHALKELKALIQWLCVNSAGNSDSYSEKKYISQRVYQYYLITQLGLTFDLNDVFVL